MGYYQTLNIALCATKYFVVYLLYIVVYIC